MPFSKSVRITSLLAVIFVVTLFIVGASLAVRAQSGYSPPSQSTNPVERTIDGLYEVLAGNSQTGPGAVIQAGRLLAIPYTHPPASGFAYLADLKNNFKLTQTTYAAVGALPDPNNDFTKTGYSGLLPIQPLWAAFRNIAYLGFVIMFVIIGFMIMIRSKIDQRTVVSVQQAIPSLIVGLILVTFSYAIVGFMIDLMNVFIAVMIQVFVLQGLLNPGGGVGQAPQAQTTIFNSNLAELARDFWNGSINNVADTIGTVVDELVTDALGGVLGTITGFLTANVLKVVFMVAVLWAALKTFIGMIGAYVAVIVMTIIGPLQIMVGVLPGQSGIGFGRWLRTIIANLAIFPVVAFMVILAAIMVNSGNADFGVSQDAIINTQNDKLWKPPLIFGSGQGGLNSGEGIQGIVGLGIFLIIPQAGKMVQDALKAGGLGAGAGAIATTGQAGRIAAYPFVAAGKAIQRRRREEELARIGGGGGGGGRP